MSIEQQARANFEAWAKPRGYPIHRRDFPESERHGQYGNAYTEDAWQAWCAALASQPQAPAAAVPDRRAEAWQEAFDHAVAVHRRNKSKSWLLECLRDDYEHWLAAAPAPEVSR